MNTHDELIKRGFHWLKNKMTCAVIVSEFVAGGTEIADVIGWRGWGSILIEAKCSVEDFRADQQKFFRREPDRGMGINRYYIIPIELKDKILPLMPPRWGLLTCGKKSIFVERQSQAFEIDHHNEVMQLLSIIRRISKSSEPLTGMGVRYYTGIFPETRPARAELFVKELKTDGKI